MGRSKWRRKREYSGNDKYRSRSSNDKGSVNQRCPIVGQSEFVSQINYTKLFPYSFFLKKNWNMTKTSRMDNQRLFFFWSKIILFIFLKLILASKVKKSSNCFFSSQVNVMWFWIVISVKKLNRFFCSIWDLFRVSLVIQLFFGN